MSQLNLNHFYIWIHSFLKVSLVFMRVELVELESLQENKKAVEPVETISQEFFGISIQGFYLLSYVFYL